MQSNPEIRTVAGAKAFSAVRAELLDLAFDVASGAATSGVLVLVHPKIREDKLEEEWRAVRKTFRPTILDRLAMVLLFKDGRSRTFPAALTSVQEASWKSVAATVKTEVAHPLRPPDYAFLIVELLIYAWLTNRGPVPTAWLMKTAGCSYPTVASVLRRLGKMIQRHSYRRVELRDFPREEWARLLVLSNEARSVRRFVDRSGQPRPPAALVARLTRMQRTDIAVGGVVGARHHYPRLDLHGTPRLDLTVHRAGKAAQGLEFISRLDPALKETSDAQEPAQVVVHFLRRKEPFFEKTKDGTLWADPVQCLLDLHEARLEPQALGLLNALIARRETKHE
jgi:hypothetical protein